MKKQIWVVLLLVLAIFIICFIVFMYGQKDNGEGEPFFYLSYSTSSDVEESIQVIIDTNGIEVFNATLIPEKGRPIYHEEAQGDIYHVKVIWNDTVSQMDFRPNGLNTLSLSIRNGIIGLKEITD